MSEGGDKVKVYWNRYCYVQTAIVEYKDGGFVCNWEGNNRSLASCIYNDPLNKGIEIIGPACRNNNS